MGYRLRKWAPAAVIAAASLVAGAVFPVSASSPEPQVAWAHAFGGAGFEEAQAVAVDPSGNVYITGYFEQEVDFDPSDESTHQLQSEGMGDIFVLKLDSAGALVWAHAIGGSGADEGLGIAVDPAGNVHVTGRFQGTVDFDPSDDSSHILQSSAGSDIFVLKLDTDGGFEWAHRFGTGSGDAGEAIAVDAEGNVYITGWFQAIVDFDPDTGSSHLLESAGNTDIFVLKLDPGGGFVWAHGFGDDLADRGDAIAVDAHGNVIVTGLYQGTVDFDPDDASDHELESAGGTDIFVLKLDADGALVWVHGFGSGGSDRGESVTVDGAGDVYVTGSFSQTVDFDPAADASHPLMSAGSRDAFTAKYTDAGQLVWATQFSGGDSVAGKSLALGIEGTVLVAGTFEGDTDFDPSGMGHLIEGQGDDDAFIAQLDAGGTLVWAHAFAGESGDEGHGVAADMHGSAFVVGVFQETVDFDPGPESLEIESAGGDDAFVVKLVQQGVTRLAGQNRFETAATVAAHHYPGGALAAFVATGLNFPDALTGAGPAGLNAAPLLLTGSLPEATSAALDALGVSEIVLLGGPAAVSAADAAALGTWGAVTRLDGPTRYETAIDISQFAYPDGADVVVVATGENFPDALAAASAATALGGPVLLTPTASLHQAVVDEITRLDPAQILVAGGPAAISNDVFAALGAIRPTARVAGADRYATAVALSQHAFAEPALIDHLYVAVGSNFPDALAGAAGAAATGAPVLLTPTDALPQSVIDEIARLGPTRIYILGGTAVVSQAVESQLAGLLP